MINFNDKDGPLSIIIDYISDISIMKETLFVSHAWKELTENKHSFEIMFYLIDNNKYYNSYLCDEVNIMLWIQNPDKTGKYIRIDYKDSETISFIIYKCIQNPLCKELKMLFRKEYYEIEYDVTDVIRCERRNYININNPKVLQYYIMKLLYEPYSFYKTDNVITLINMPELRNWSHRLIPQARYLEKIIRKIYVSQKLFYRYPVEIWRYMVCGYIKKSDLTLEDMTYYMLLHTNQDIIFPHPVKNKENLRKYYILYNSENTIKKHKLTKTHVNKIKSMTKYIKNKDEINERISLYTDCIPKYRDKWNI